MSELTDFLVYVPIFSDLPKSTLQKIADAGKRKTYLRDSVILMEEDDGSALFIIIGGKIKIVRSSNDGREVILKIMNESDFFGEMSIIDGLTRSATAIAMVESDIFVIQRDEFLNLLKDHSEIALALLNEFTKRLRSADQQIKSLSLKDAEGKVATVISQIADETGRIKQGVVEIENVPLQQDLANMAGTSRETISRTVQGFVKQGYLETAGTKMKIFNYEEFKEMYVKK